MTEIKIIRKVVSQNGATTNLNVPEQVRNVLKIERGDFIYWNINEETGEVKIEKVK